jgi:integrase
MLEQSAAKSKSPEGAGRTAGTGFLRDCNPNGQSLQTGIFTGDRDAAILLCLLDTGARANEFLSINLEDINQARGDILIRQGKGHKPRTVYVGKQSKRALRRYLKHRQDDYPALW